METGSRKRVPPEAKIIGRNLRDLRRERGVSRREIAEILGVSLQQVQKYEAGENRFPLDRLQRLKDIFDIPYDSFFKGIDDMAHAKKKIHSPANAKLRLACEALEHMRSRKLRDRICEAVLILTG